MSFGRILTIKSPEPYGKEIAKNFNNTQTSEIILQFISWSGRVFLGSGISQKNSE